ncbi:uncharacterized protein F5Z01DRAFT_235052 [Emericellopsis atlantica]|uniref:Uncharacterized protein n=1 Tax=Emericellopsis atlantica TaxID=2614577 RepID=A0A9P8CM82_9HYPO|nr:uncharacterized protein F5Z01DRAFT_235052 [Emericellopsis atlantica]KAG9252178.1 hypothetical protein F5Z01DRAFT_235052 [Emericellopsis atlantica]
MFLYPNASGITSQSSKTQAGQRPRAAVSEESDIFLHVPESHHAAEQLGFIPSSITAAVGSGMDILSQGRFESRPAAWMQSARPLIKDSQWSLSCRTSRRYIVEISWGYCRSGRSPVELRTWTATNAGLWRHCPQSQAVADSRSVNEGLENWKREIREGLGDYCFRGSLVPVQGLVVVVPTALLLLLAQ